MINFWRYQSLDTELLPYVTQLWVYGVLEKSGAKNFRLLPYEIAKRELATYGYQRRAPERVIKSKYFYKKKKGVTFKSSNRAEQLEPLINGTIAILTHPLWIMLSRQKLLSHELLTLAKELPYSMLPRIMNKQGTALCYKPKTNVLASTNSFDALCGLMLVYAWIIQNESTEQQIRYGLRLNNQIMKLCLRLCIKYPELIKESYLLIQRVQLRFSQEAHTATPAFSFALPNSSVRQGWQIIHDFPFHLTHIKDQQSYYACLLVYDTILSLARDNGIEIEPTFESETKFLGCVNHSSVEQLIVEFTKCSSAAHLSHFPTISQVLRLFEGT